MKKTGFAFILSALAGGFLWMGAQNAQSAIPSYTAFFLCDQPNFVIGRFPAEEGIKETEMYFRILGKIDVPSTGYSYKLVVNEDTATTKKSEKTMNLILKNPESVAAQVITSLSIDNTLKFGESITEITIDVADVLTKDAPHKKISCTLEAE